MYKPIFKCPPKPASSIYERVQSLKEIHDLGARQTGHLNLINKNSDSRSQSFHTVKVIVQKHSKNKVALYEALKAQMSGEISFVEPANVQKLKEIASRNQLYHSQRNSEVKV